MHDGDVLTPASRNTIRRAGGGKGKKKSRRRESGRSQNDDRCGASLEESVDDVGTHPLKRSDGQGHSQEPQHRRRKTRKRQ